ncbi:MAG: class A beta-lactamase-related serine hydrolase [Anaerolineae bacterium]|jgi:beta-lactamase class A|nr:class A beta-lactamase-related serine hydrolase [Anaerolineae bacterium]
MPSRSDPRLTQSGDHAAEFGRIRAGKYNRAMELTQVGIVDTLREVTASVSFDYALYYRKRGSAPVLLKTRDLFLSASIIKIPILLAWAHLERGGAVSSDEQCDLDAEPAIQGAGFSWLLRGRTVPYHDVLLWMMTVSDNLCANLVIRRVGLARLNETFRELGLPDARIERKLMDYEARARGLENRVSVADCIRLYEVLDALPDDQRAWIEPMLLWNTDLGLWLRNVARDTVDFYHKTGNITGVLHDWGYTREADLFLLTQNVADEKEVYRLLDRLGPLLLRG